MRIISGKYGGRRLTSFTAGHIRPTTDRVKESMFNIFQGSLEDARVLDLFSGTGSLGIEAISREARHVTFVESNKKSIQILRKNLELLAIEDRFTIRVNDVFSYLKKSEDTFDLIFIDPPFTEALAHATLLALAGSKCWERSTLIAIESGHGEKIESSYGDLVQKSSRDYGDKKLSIYKVENGGHEQK